MAKDKKVATYRTGKGGEAMTTVTDRQVKQLRDAGALVAVRRVRGVR
jgi:hypothetical protein